MSFSVTAHLITSWIRSLEGVEAKLNAGAKVADFDLICFMDCLHDMGDPIGAADHARQRINQVLLKL
ncbi:MAG: hypothetical protein ABFS24_05120 [Pseudomonadota bacterium]